MTETNEATHSLAACFARIHALTEIRAKRIFSPEEEAELTSLRRLLLHGMARGLEKR